MLRMITVSIAPAEVAGDAAEQQPERERDRDADQADRQRDLRAVEQPREHVAPERIGAEQVDAAGRVDAEQVHGRSGAGRGACRRAAHEEAQRHALRHAILFVAEGRRVGEPRVADERPQVEAARRASTQCRACGGWK